MLLKYFYYQIAHVLICSTMYVVPNTSTLSNVHFTAQPITLARVYFVYLSIHFLKKHR